MQIFTSLESSNKAAENQPKRAEKTTMDKNGKASTAPTRPRLSESEIREKIEQHRQKILDRLSVSDKSRMLLKKVKSRQSGNNIDDGPMENMDEVALNKFQGPEAKQKLKNIVGTGSFNFSEKERKVLEQILK